MIVHIYSDSPKVPSPIYNNPHPPGLPFSVYNTAAGKSPEKSHCTSAFSIWRKAVQFSLSLSFNNLTSFVSDKRMLWGKALWLLGLIPSSDEVRTRGGGFFLSHFSQLDGRSVIWTNSMGISFLNNIKWNWIPGCDYDAACVGIMKALTPLMSVPAVSTFACVSTHWCFRYALHQLQTHAQRDLHLWI